ncbi:heme-binding protein [Halioxenophilus aromaticivorans]
MPIDGAFLGSVDVAIRKAKTACLFPLPTRQFGELIRKSIC